MASKEPEEEKRPKKFKYDVFIVHSSLNEKLARQINEALVKLGFHTCAHYKEGSEFGIGKFVVEGIKDAVEKSRIVLVLLTPEAMESHWVTLELLMSFEKSVASGEMCIRLVVYNLTDDQLIGWKDLESIPKIRIDFNRDDWASTLAAKIRDKHEMTDILPAGNVAHGLVFNYFTGFLNHILKGFKENIQKSEYYKQNKDMMLEKFIILLPESCKIPQIEGHFGTYTIVKVGCLDIQSGHGDKMRSYKPAIYSITNQKEVRYFLGENPTIMEALAKLSEFVPKFDKRLQVRRFGQTLMDFVNHKSNPEFNNTVVFEEFDGDKTSHADVIWKAIDSNIGQAPSPKVQRKVGKTEERPGYATVTFLKEGHDQETAKDVMDHLEKKKISFENGEGKLEQDYLRDARWNIFVFSKDSFKDPAMMLQYNAAITESIDDNEVQVIPVLTQNTDILDLPQVYRGITVLQSSKQGYLEELTRTMESEPSEMEKFWPAGKLYEGLGWAYLLNYLPIALLSKTADGKDFVERFKDGMAKYKTEGSKCIAKVFIMVPKTCQFPPPGAYFEGEKHLGPLEPAVVGFRKYFLQFYQITMDNGETVCYAREYATPAVALHEMAHKFSKSSGLTKPEMYEQSQQLSEFLVQVIEDKNFQTAIGDISKRCTIVHFNDEKMGIPEMTNELKKRLAQCIASGEFVSQ